MAHEIDYIVHGNKMQFVEIQLDPGESVVAEAGGMMMYMDDGIRMETIFGDGSEQGGSGGLSSKLFRRQTLSYRRKPIYDGLYQPGTRPPTGIFCCAVSWQDHAPKSTPV